MGRLPLIGLASCCASFGQSADSWKFLPAYPNHLLATKLRDGETITMDGKLDDPAWQEVEFSASKFVDITNHSQPSENAVPEIYQTRLKVRWDQNFLYIGAELREPFQYGTITGHNGPSPPYHDNDFEVFIDVSGTSQYYKEFEMNILNATYDVNWGVPDDDGLNCDNSNNRSLPYLPVCTDTSFPGYPGNWTMTAAEAGLGGGGLTTATHYSPASFESYQLNSSWTLEIAFPIQERRDAQGDRLHGGLLSADAATEEGSGGMSYVQFDPTRGGAGNGRPRYWRIDFARAVHPREFVEGEETGLSQWCPLNCTESLGSASPSLIPPNTTQCAFVKHKWPTLLGVNPWSCYWEWVFQSLGFNAYMHRPSRWAMLQFVSSPADKVSPAALGKEERAAASAECGDIEFPGRHIASQLFLAQRQFFAQTNGSFAKTAQELLPYCTEPVCAKADLALALRLTDIFAVDITVVANNTKPTFQCTQRPCFTALINVTVPAGGEGSGNANRWQLPSKSYGYGVSINENRFVKVRHPDSEQLAPCLF